MEVGGMLITVQIKDVLLGSWILFTVGSNLKDFAMCWLFCTNSVYETC